MSKKTESTTTKQIVDYLNETPGWHTVKEIDAGLNGAIARRTISTTLKGLWDNNDPSVRRSHGPRTSTGKPTADVWSGSTTTTPPPGLDLPAAPASNLTDAATEAEPSTPQEVADESATATEDEAGDTAAADRPAVAAAVPPNPNVIAVAGILGDHAETGITASALAAASGVNEALVWRILVAADIAGAAISDKPYVLDPAAHWRPGEGDLGHVDPAATPSQVDCPTCGQSKRIPAGRSGTGQRGGGARGGVCADGGAPLAPGGLGKKVAEWAAANPGVQKTTGEITKAVGGRSSGAVLNALRAMAGKKDPQVSELYGVKPTTWRTAESTSTDTN